MAIHTGTFSVSLRRGTVMGQNVSASLALSSVLSFALAVIAAVVASAFGLEANLNLGQLAMVSIVGGVAASVLVLVATVGLAVLGVRRNWDLDNLVAPSVSTLGDVITVPMLYLASLALELPSAVTTGGGVGAGARVGGVVRDGVALPAAGARPGVSRIGTNPRDGGRALDDGRRRRDQAAQRVRPGADAVHPGSGVRVQRRGAGRHPQLAAGHQVAPGPRRPRRRARPGGAPRHSHDLRHRSPPSFSTMRSGPSCSDA